MSMHLPTIFMRVLLLPVYPLLSLTLQVWTPASRDLRKFSEIVCEDELEAKQLLQFEDQLYDTWPVYPVATHFRVTAEAVR